MSDVKMADVYRIDKRASSQYCGLAFLFRWLRPEFFLAGLFHFALTSGTGFLVPNPDVIAATLQTQTARLASVRWSHVGNDATHHDVLDGMAVWARHGRNLLSKESTTFVHLSLVATLLAAISQFPRHFNIRRV